MWIDGQWLWRGRRWAWIEGYWAADTKAVTYSPWQLSRGQTGVLYMAVGTWRNAKGEAVEVPPPLAVGSSRRTGVVSAEGEREPTGATLSPDPRERRRP